jgi:hypothetical protein|nr:pyocin activator PrtN family protein [Neorhizobium tomejilense]
MEPRDDPSLRTAVLLIAQYGSRVLVSIDDVCRDYFSHLSPEKFLRKVTLGEINLPVIRMEASQKCQKGVHLQDLADFIDKRRDAALKELFQLRNLRPKEDDDGVKDGCS